MNPDAGPDGSTGGEWWQDESGHWHFGGPAEYWYRDAHHQWHQGGSQLWRQDENGNWHEVQEDHPTSEDEKMMAGLDNDMGEQEDDIKDLDDLNHALKDDMPQMDPSFTPSIENIITQSGPSELGKEVARLSRSLGMLKDDVNSNLSQDRIAAMTAEDVPNMVTPVAASLKEVITSAKSLKGRLGAIADAAYSIVGTAAEDAEDRLSGEEHLNESPDEQIEEQDHMAQEGDYGYGVEGDYSYGGGHEDYGYGNGGYEDYSYGHGVSPGVETPGGNAMTPDMVHGAQLPLLAPEVWRHKLHSARRRRSFL